MKKIVGKFIDMYAEYDPRIYIQTYTRKERKKKSKAITITPVTKEQKKEIKNYGGENRGGLISIIQLETNRKPTYIVLIHGLHIILMQKLTIGKCAEL